VDDLTTDDIKRFATDHFPAEEPSRIEWIDDTSANIVYSSEDVGLQALNALTQPNDEDGTSLPSLRLRTARSLSTHPESVLQVRTAVKTDRKRPRAHEVSRFYLMHPEHDPREKLRRELAERRRQARRDDSPGDYRRRQFDEHEHRRRRREDGFAANMYDDADSNRRAGSSEDISDAGGRHRSRRGRRKELFPENGGDSGRLRDRSASPGREDMDSLRRTDDERRQSRRRFRERSPLAKNEAKELFPSKVSSDSDSQTRELFPNKTSASYLKKELFPSKTNSNHRRSDAFDAADETADLFAKRINVPLTDGAQDRVNNPDTGEMRGMINIRGAASNDQGISIRGSANGISIKGSATASVKELFPSKYNQNARKELFSDKLEGRGGRRRKAEDMFY
jgi:hypothetical protein